MVVSFTVLCLLKLKFWLGTLCLLSGNICQEGVIISFVMFELNDFIVFNDTIIISGHYTNPAVMLACMSLFSSCAV